MKLETGSETRLVIGCGDSKPEKCIGVDIINTDFEKVVVTADHGEALGEFGVYAHPRWVHHPKVRIVPWLEISSTDMERKTGDAESD